jgi:hypothetical protein
VARFRVYIYASKRLKCPHPDSTEMSWMRVQMGMMELGAPDSSNCLILLPRTVILKARTTATVLANTVETATVNTTPTVVCWRMQLAVLGQPMKRKEQRKQKVREMSGMYVRPWSLVLTMGVCWCNTKSTRIAGGRTVKLRVMPAMVFPKRSSQAKKLHFLEAVVMLKVGVLMILTLHIVFMSGEK